MSADDETNPLKSVEPIHHTNEEYEELQQYAKDKGIDISRIHAFDGDSSVLKSQIDAIAEMREEYGITKKTTITFDDMSGADIAKTSKNGSSITFDRAALRNRELTEKYINEDNACWQPQKRY